MSAEFASDAAAPPGSPQGETAELSPEELRNSTILIVDDNLQNLELLQAYLEGLSCRIITATNGLEALALVDSDPPDVILLDVMMPRMSGFEVCKKLKADPQTRTIPILMVTALNELGDIERGVECGTDDFLTKPVNKLELTTRVKSLLRVRHLRRELDRTRAHIDQVQSDADDTGRDD
ncbi:MAG: response regulator [Phycisphaerae bacterium]|nr:response regulator [Phycisphaerae bacterium]